MEQKEYETNPSQQHVVSVSRVSDDKGSSGRVRLGADIDGVDVE